MSHSKLSSTRNWLNKPEFITTALLTLRTQVLSRGFLYKSLSVSLVYLIFSQFANEFAIYSNIFSQQFDTILKLKITGLMFLKALTIFGTFNLILTLAIALMVGLNIMLVSRKVIAVRAQKNTHWTFGAGILSLASTSCPGCGFSLLSVTGLTTAIPGIPMQGIIFSSIILGVLSITAIYNLQSLGKISCALRTK